MQGKQNSHGNGYNGNGKKYFETKDFGKREQNRRLPRPDEARASQLTDATPDTFSGLFSIGKNGIGFVNHRESGGALMVEPQHSMHALHRDTVTVRVIDRKQGLGEVISIDRRAKTGYAGILAERGDHLVCIPTDMKDPEIRIEGADRTNLGKKCIASIARFEGDFAYGTIASVLGDAGENNAEMLAIALERGFASGFPEAVIREAEKLKDEGLAADEIAKRRDMRNITTFTIDPIDAKDFDDALSFQTLPDGNYEIGVHIADVSHYVRPGMALDEEARSRTTSVYLVDRCIPMLPEVLSNDLCSLRADEDKFTFSTIFTINPKTGEVIDTWYGRTVIKSNKRFTYEEAQEIMDKGEGLYYTELTELNRLAKIYTEQRGRDGALWFDQDEVRFVLDEAGKPIRIMIKQRIDTNKLIEEFMLLANKYVAIRLSKKDAAGIAVYRIHDKPALDRMEDLAKFLKTLGYTVPMKDGVIPPHELQKIINDAATDDARDTIQSSIIRTMAKAIYSTDNIGHYGLAFSYYTHFTSPIRRYPDVLVHRLLQMTLDGEKATTEEASDFIHMSSYSSDRERDAQEAERASIKYKQVEYMSERVGQVFDGVVTGVGKFGVFVAERESKSEGMIRLADLGQDFYSHIAEENCVKGRNTGETFRIGSKLKILVKEASLEKRVIDYARVLPTPVNKKEEVAA